MQQAPSPSAAEQAHKQQRPAAAGGASRESSSDMHFLQRLREAQQLLAELEAALTLQRAPAAGQPAAPEAIDSVCMESTPLYNIQ